MLLLRFKQAQAKNLMATVTVEIPDSLMSKLERNGQVVQDIVLEALEQYIEAEGMAFSLP